jgi:hypothetical protein
MKSIYTVAVNCYLEIKPDGHCSAIHTGFALFKGFTGKQYRRKLQEKKLAGDYRYMIRFNNELLLLPFNVQNKLTDKV